MTSTEQAHTLAALSSDRRMTALGLLWGGVLMVLLALWLPAKHPDILVLLPVIAWVLAAVGFGTALWQWLARPRGNPEQAAQALASQRRALGAILAVSGAVLLLLGGLLFSWYRLEAFGECFGLLVLGLIALVAGLAHLRPIDQSIGHDRILQFLLERRDLLAVVLFALAAALLLGAGLLGIRTYGREGVPEWGAAILIACLALAGGVWLRVTRGHPVTLAHMRLFVLIGGSLTGLVLAVSALIRGVLLGGEFFKGIAGWTGADSWQLWLTVYLEMIGLALMFASLTLAQAEIRVNAVLRRLLYGYNAVLNGLLLLTILTVLNIGVYVSYPNTFDWRATGLSDLSPDSKILLANLKEPTKIYVLMAPSYGGVYSDLHNLLDNAQTYTDRLQVVYISPDRDPGGYRELVRKYPELSRDQKALRDNPEASGRGVLIVYGPESEAGNVKVPHSFLNSSSLTDVKNDMQPDHRSRVTQEFKGEPAIMTELKFLMANKQKPKVYFLQGDGEYDIADLTRDEHPIQGGLGLFVDRLKKENYEARGLSFRLAARGARNDEALVYAQADKDGKKDVPADAKVVVIAGPRAPLEKEVIDALDRFMDRNGKVVALVDIDGPWSPNGQAIQPTPLEEWLKKFGVNVTGDFVFSVPTKPTQDPDVVQVDPAPDSKNPIAKNFRGANKKFVMYRVRVVQPQPSPASPYQAETLLQVTGNQHYVLTDSRIAVLKNPFGYIQALARNNSLEEKLNNEAIPMAVAVSDRDGKPRMIVMGTSFFITNFYMQSSATGAYDLQANFLEWLAERPSGIGSIRPKTSSSFALDASASRSQLILLPGWLMVVGIIGLGTGIWIVRRR